MAYSNWRKMAAMVLASGLLTTAGWAQTPSANSATTALHGSAKLKKTPGTSYGGGGSFSKVWNFGTVCGGNSFKTCASVQLAIVGKEVTMVVTNVSGIGNDAPYDVFTQIGLGAVGDINFSKGITATDGYGNPLSAWSLDKKAVSGAGLTELGLKQVQGVDPALGIQNGIKPGSTVRFVFYLQDTPMATISPVIAIHGQGGPNDCSTKLVFDQYYTYGDGFNASCTSPPPPSIAPEPATMVLLGSGLFGLFAADRVRRRRRAS